MPFRKAKAQAQVKTKSKRISSSFNLKLNLSLLRSLRPCMGQGAFRRAGVGRVRSLAFLSILRGVLLLSQMHRLMKFRRAHRVFPQPVRHGRERDNSRHADIETRLAPIVVSVFPHAIDFMLCRTPQHG